MTVVRSDAGAAGGNVFGGYSGSAAWSTSGWINASDAFLFSLHNMHGRAVKLQCTDPQYALYCGSSCGPMFGGGYDLHIDGTNSRGSNYCDPHSYKTCDPTFHVCTVDNTLLAGNERQWVATEVEVFGI